MKKQKFVKLLMSFFAFISVGGSLAVGSKTSLHAHAETPAEELTAKYSSIVWDNVVYDEANKFIPSGAFGRCSESGLAQEGYVVLAFFTYSDGSGDSGLSLGTLCDASSPETMAASNLADDDCAKNVKLNGVSINDVANAGLYIYPFNGLLFYLPHDSLDFSQYSVPTITVSTKINLGLIDIEPFSLEFKGTLGTQGGWKVAKDKTLMRTVEYQGIAGGWNNVSSGSASKNTILNFGNPDTDFLKNDQTSDPTNLVTVASDCGNMVTINGIQLKYIPGAVISYAHGKSYVYIDLPKTALVPSNGYKIVTFHIENSCEFHDVLLPEVTLYLFNDLWQETCPAYPEDEEYEGALNLTDCLSKEAIKLDAQNTRFDGEFANIPTKFGFYVDYLLTEKEDSVIMFLFGTTGQNGLRIVAKENTISIYDSTSSNRVLGSYELSLFTYGDWNALFVYGELNNGVINVKVAVDDITYIQVPNTALEAPNAIGKKASFVLGGGTAEVRNGVLGRDIKKPIITYMGKAVYGVTPGTKKIDFALKTDAYDFVDGNVNDKIQYIWQEGSLTNDFINAGDWVVSIVASDNAGNKATHKVRVICKDALDVTVTFDGENATTYRVGDNIAKPANPTGNEDIEFVGWYYNGILWDFENDYVVQDMNLDSKFKKVVTEYQVTVNITGLDINSYSLFFVENTLVSVSIFEIEGYTLVAKMDGEEIDSFRVDKDLVITLEYTNLNPNNGDNKDKKGCRGSVIASAGLISLMSGVALALLGLKKKEDR